MKLREAVNAISDVVQNRPPPIREFDQIYMKVADMVIQADYVANAFREKEVVFVGDGDSIALATLHLKKQGIIDYGPRRIVVLDFDERIVNSIERFAESNGLGDTISSHLYNVVDPLPGEYIASFDAFYTNPPWGASNGGESVLVFLERGMEALRTKGIGALVIGDDSELEWTQEVLHRAQTVALSRGFVVAEMTPRMHLYHLDDAPNLRSCCCLFRHVGSGVTAAESRPLDDERRRNFYGRESPLIFRYVREHPTLNYGRAAEATYRLEKLEE
jgi:N4-bis(aminopropyl)spermidine synthase